MGKFKLGQLVFTRGVNDRVAEETPFAEHVSDSLARYIRCDWGDTCEEDKRTNNDALACGDRILAVYGKDDGNRIWIITEWDRSVTTVLFPDEY